MPNLADLTDYDPQSVIPEADGIRRVYITGNSTLPVDNTVVNGAPEAVVEIPVSQPSKTSSLVNSVINKLFRDDDQRYQLWPEKVVREALTGANRVMEEGSNLGLRREDVTDIPAPNMPTKDSTWLGEKLGIAPVYATPQDNIIEKAQAISALAGTGGLAGTESGAVLNATPSLRPALKYKDRLYKGKEGQQHMDVIPQNLYPEFQKMAMSGEDISHYNFGFVNDKGHFLSREDALKYGIDNGIIDPQAGKYGALTSTLMADSSKPGTAIEAMAKTANPRKYMEVKKAIDDSDPNYVYHITNSERADLIANEGLKLHKPNEFTDQTVWPDGSRDKRNYFTPTAKNSWQFAPEEGTPALLRIKKDSHEFKSERTGDIYSKKPVPSDKIEYLNDEGKWVALKADSSKPAAAIQANKQGFYSALEHNVSQINQTKMNGEAWLGTLSNKPGVKPEELQWTGLADFLTENKGKPVTKAQIEEHLAANKVELKEVSKGGDATKEQAFSLAKEHGWQSWDAIDPATQAKYMERASKEGGGTPTKYSSYQLPGGENYREKLLTLPTKRKQIGVSEGEFGGMPIVEQTPSQPFKSSHWDEPNILAHVRMNDRTIDGKKSLHLEEIQSDWHQAGREKGYKGEKPLNDKERIEYHDLNMLPDKVRTAEQNVRLEDLTKKSMANSYGVPAAPFKSTKSWSELALKRMLREASEKGYDKLSWTAGEHHPTNPKNLKQTGEAAEKADKGMQGFYNDILPKVVEKLGKEHGVKVKVHEIDKARTYVDQFGKTKHEPAKIYYIDIPQSLRDTAMHKGFPLFSSTHMFVPVDYEPEFKK